MSRAQQLKTEGELMKSLGKAAGRIKNKIKNKQIQNFYKYMTNIIRLLIFNVTILFLISNTAKTDSQIWIFSDFGYVRATFSSF